MMKYTYTPTTPSEALQEQCKDLLSPLALSILSNRGLQSYEEVKAFVTSDLDLVTSRTNLLDMDKGTALIREAIEAKSRIVVYRDYDCDGITSGSIMVETLSALGAVVTHYANQRTVDGYGLKENGIRTIMEKYPDTKVILTVDNGISAFAGIAYAKSIGLTVVVTDHHESGEQLPDADAIINPKRQGESYPFPEICGATVAFKFMIHLYRSMGKDIQPVLDCLDLVALATIADVMPLLDENRSIVREGMKLITQGKRPFFQAMNMVSGGDMTSARSLLGFGYGPMVNAISRMEEDTDVVVKGMLSKELPEAFEVAYTLKFNNEERKRITREHDKRVSAEVAELIANNPALPAVVLWDDTIPSGIVGIIAGRIMNEFYRPCVILCEASPGLLKGSIRGIEGMNIKDVLDLIPKDVLSEYGGHAKAAGLSLKIENFDAFQDWFCRLTLEAFDGNLPIEERKIDALLAGADCTLETLEELQALEPFGEKFPEALFGLTTEISDFNTMGAEQQHLKFIPKDYDFQILKWFGAEDYTPGSPLPSKFVGTLSSNTFREEQRVQFMYETFR